MSFKTRLYFLYESILDFIFPKDFKCLICKENEGEGLCISCESSIYKLPEDDESYGIYKGVLKELIFNLKFLKDFNSGEILVHFLEEKIRDKEGYYLTFIPCSKEKLKKRGFNQCEYLAKKLGKRLDIKVVETLEKVKITKDQKTLKAKDREKNIENAFEGKNIKIIENNKFILIDDVITTGSTIAEGIKILKKYGAKEIKILTIAKSNV